MALYALIDKETRIIVSLSKRNEMLPNEKFELVEVPDSMNDVFQREGAKYKVLNEDLTVRDATTKEVDTAGVDPEVEREKKIQAKAAMKKAIKDMLADEAVPQSIKDFFRAYAKFSR